MWTARSGARLAPTAFLCMTMPTEYGGAGADRLFAVAQMEVNAETGYSGIGFSLHNEIVAPYIARYGTEAQKRVSCRPWPVAR
jgi:alkylation response protein AidB-like acyl-CoA dehydrogenase